jgi:hypothetical protein
MDSVEQYHIFTFQCLFRTSISLCALLFAHGICISYFQFKHIIMVENTPVISSRTFLKRHVFPTLPTDQFNDNKCCFCWSPYDDTDHPGVRILPCNHVIGRDCLKTIVKAKGGDLCPICRVSLFRPRPMETWRFLEFYCWPIVFAVCVVLIGGPALVATLLVAHFEQKWEC